MIMEQIRKQFPIPIAVLCRRLELPRAFFYRRSTKDDSELAEKIKAIAFEHPAWGYRMIMAELHKLGIESFRQGSRVNHKKIYRIYCRANLQKPPLVSKKKHTRITQPFTATPAEFPGHVWAGDFLHDRITTGKTFRIFNVLDVFTRRGFEPPIDFSLSGSRIAHNLDSLCTLYGPPRVFRQDDGPEFHSAEFQKTIRKWRIKEGVIPPAQPFNNGHMESNHGNIREELLNREEFDSLRHAQERIRQWIKSYNTERPHSALDYKPPIKVWNEYYGS